jgi:hypothetical protein
MDEPVAFPGIKETVTIPGEAEVVQEEKPGMLSQVWNWWKEKNWLQKTLDVVQDKTEEAVQVMKSDILPKAVMLGVGGLVVYILVKRAVR